MELIFNSKLEILRGLTITIFIWAIIIIYSFQLDSIGKQLLFILFMIMFMFGIPIILIIITSYGIYQYLRKEKWIIHKEGKNDYN